MSGAAFGPSPGVDGGRRLLLTMMRVMTTLVRMLLLIRGLLSKSRCSSVLLSNSDGNNSGNKGDSENVDSG